MNDLIKEPKKKGWTKGKKRTDENKQKISAANKGNICTNETREKLSKANKGKKRTEKQIKI